jgi:hypothetical protein
MVARELRRILYAIVNIQPICSIRVQGKAFDTCLSKAPLLIRVKWTLNLFMVTMDILLKFDVQIRNSLTR